MHFILSEAGNVDHSRASLSRVRCSLSRQAFSLSWDGSADQCRFTEASSLLQQRLGTAGILERGRAQAFVAIVAANAPEHFRSSDLPLLVSYVQAAVLGDQAAAELRNGAVIDGRPSPWLVVQEKCVRTLSALSLRLRLAPQSRLDPKTVGRHRGYEGPPPWVR